VQTQRSSWVRALLALSQHSEQLSNENSLKCFDLWKELLAEAKLQPNFDGLTWWPIYLLTLMMNS